MSPRTFHNLLVLTEQSCDSYYKEQSVKHKINHQIELVKLSSGINLSKWIRECTCLLST